MIAEFLKYTISLVLRGLSKLEYSDNELTDLKMKDKNNHKNDDMNNNINKHQKSLICIYTNKDKNEFAIGLKDDEHFRAMTKVGEFYTRFVDAFDRVLDENEVYWKQALKRWIAAAKKMKRYLSKWI
jgi:hypothetical protein